MSRKQVAALLGVSTATVSKIEAAGKLQAIRLTGMGVNGNGHGCPLFFRRRDVLALIGEAA